MIFHKLRSFLKKYSRTHKSVKQSAVTLDPENVEKAFNSMLTQYGLNHYVTIDLIKKWIYDREDIRDFSFLSLLVGLAPESSFEQIQNITDQVFALYRISPQKLLDGGSPLQRTKNQGSSGELVLFDCSLGNTEWSVHYERAMELMNQRKNRKALKAFNEAFKKLLYHRTTTPEIYRLFANKAMALFYSGEILGGEMLLRMALALNPNYDFAQKMLDRLEKGTLGYAANEGMMKLILEVSAHKKINSKENLHEAISRITQKKMRKDPAYIYFNYLQLFKINFATDKITKSQITFIGPDGHKKVSRNDPCDCGSGEKYKRCCLANIL